MTATYRCPECGSTEISAYGRTYCAVDANTGEVVEDYDTEWDNGYLSCRGCGFDGDGFWCPDTD